VPPEATHFFDINQIMLLSIMSTKGDTIWWLFFCFVFHWSKGTSHDGLMVELYRYQLKGSQSMSNQQMFCKFPA